MSTVFVPFLTSLELEVPQQQHAPIFGPSVSGTRGLALVPGKRDLSRFDACQVPDKYLVVPPDILGGLPRADIPGNFLPPIRGVLVVHGQRPLEPLVLNRTPVSVEGSGRHVCLGHSPQREYRRRGRRLCSRSRRTFSVQELFSSNLCPRQNMPNLKTLGDTVMFDLILEMGQEENSER
ncbi:hypothetical protein MLD38_000763 [Melastoma candidum]|uniref:Uncharacterized protein n=1 Tax=Melastoma candidum TaxID=119954 RepID=A0ACB9SAX6_9MYRT|nr:hypothetical protein MLD38_000763 [Melastoma candidum]